MSGWRNLDGAPFVPSGGRSDTDKVLSHSKRRVMPSAPMPTIGPVPTTAQEIAALRDALVTMGGTPPVLESSGPDDALFAKLQRVKRRRAHSNHARALAGRPPIRQSAHHDLASERDALAVVILLAVGLWAWAVYAAPGPVVNPLTTPPLSDCKSK